MKYFETASELISMEVFWICVTFIQALLLGLF